MRVSRRSLARDERGATILLVGLLLVVFMILLALVLDGGALYLKRRHMVNAADAAALAAALSCARHEGDAAARGWADRVAADNVSNATQTAYGYGQDGGCDADTGTVTVTFAGAQGLTFWQFVGASSSRDVSATATATWGGAGGVSGAMPFMLSLNRLGSCDIPNVTQGTNCYFWWNNNDLGNALWSMMNLDQWNVAPTDHCVSAGTTKTWDWIAGNAPLLSLNYPDPTYVCADTGVSTSVFQGKNSIQSVIGQTRYFPVNDERYQVDRNGQLAPPPATPDKYDIVGFAILKITGVYKGNTPQAKTYCGNIPGFKKDPNAWCLGTQWEGYTTSGSGIGGGENLGVVTVWLTG